MKMTFEEFKKECPCRQIIGHSESCNITYKEHYPLPCMESICPLWYLRKTIMEEIKSIDDRTAPADEGKEPIDP